MWDPGFMQGHNIYRFSNASGQHTNNLVIRAYDQAGQTPVQIHLTRNHYRTLSGASVIIHYIKEDDPGQRVQVVGEPVWQYNDAQAPNAVILRGDRLHPLTMYFTNTTRDVDVRILRNWLPRGAGAGAGAGANPLHEYFRAPEAGERRLAAGSAGVSAALHQAAGASASASADAPAAKRQKTAPAKSDINRLRCCVCHEDYSGNNKVVLPCGHAMCYDCCVNYKTNGPGGEVTPWLSEDQKRQLGGTPAELERNLQRIVREQGMHNYGFFCPLCRKPAISHDPGGPYVPRATYALFAGARLLL